MKFLIFLILAIAIHSGADCATNKDWPLIVIRHTCGINEDPTVFAKLMESHFRYPKSCDEFWFCSTGRGTPEGVKEESKRINKAFRPLCEKAGILFSYQQGVTLGHRGSKELPGDMRFSFNHI